jgi:pentatricopeptide repeat protein
LHEGIALGKESLYIELAEELDEAGQFIEARQYLEKAIELGYLDAYQVLASFLRKQGLINEAYALYEQIKTLGINVDADFEKEMAEMQYDLL